MQYENTLKLSAWLIAGFLAGMACLVGIIYLAHNTNFFEALDNLFR